ncbi:MAG: Asp-tRNA(Asn)/Glu-tRNA(Gln) amidotransferase subunit GatA [Pseudomonadales bacterium]
MASPIEPFASLDTLARGLRDGAFSSRELAEAMLARLDSLDGSLNSFITVAAERALAQADAADQRLRRGDATLLTGIPLAHKDIFCTRGLATTCGSRMLRDFVAPYDATVVARLDAAGMVTLGKTNLDEFAMGSSTENSHFGPSRNPWEPGRVPGGSSGGSAAAVAAGLVPIATGTDTGGSIRQPAALCGITGIKPTYGRVSRYGMVAFASSLDQGGVLARSAADAALVLAFMSGFDPLDATSSEHADPWLEGLRQQPLGTPARPPVIGLPRQYFDGLNVGGSALQEARRVLEGAGCRFVDIDLPHTDVAIPAYYIIAGAEASTNLSRYDGVRYGHRCDEPQSLEDLYRRSRSEGFGTEVKRRILTGTYALSVGYFDAYYLKAQQLRRLIQNDFLAAFEQVDLIFAPTSPAVAFAVGDISDDPVAMYQQDIYTTPASLAGLPAMSLPCGFHDGLPLGLQLIGPHFQERTLLETAELFQRHSDWHREHPEAFAR